MLRMVHVHLLEQLQHEFSAPFYFEISDGILQRSVGTLQLQLDHRLDPSREQSYGLFHLCSGGLGRRSIFNFEYLHN